MCAGVGFFYNKIAEDELRRFFRSQLLARLKEKGLAESFFWSPRPCLPVEDDKGQLHLYDWGNRDKEVRLPKTGWAKEESVQAGKWDYLHPKIVTIAATSGYEKGRWFDTSGMKGLLVASPLHEERVYMLTRPSSESYQKQTGHNREPVFLESPTFKHPVY